MKWLVLFCLSAFSSFAAGKPVLVHYMPWYVAKPYSPSWGFHWTMNHFNPEVTDSSGRRQVAAHYYPLIGPYDSADPVVLEYHVLLMKLAGIDGVIVDWYGMDNFHDYGVNNVRTHAIFQWAKRAELRFVLCYEDRTIREEINGGFIAASNAISHGQATLRYAESNFFTDSSYLRRRNQPIFLNFGPQFFTTNGQWSTLFSVLRATNQPSFFSLDFPVVGSQGAFSWIPMWLSQTNGGIVTTQAVAGYLNEFEQRASTWQAFVSSAFPRFVDIYAEAGVSPSHGTLPDHDGANLRTTLSRAMTNSSALIQIATWNDYGEGTVVEPTVEFGYRDLGLIQDARRQFLEPGYSRTTNDLTLATRLYDLRRRHGTNLYVMAELDRVFTNLLRGDLPVAGLRLSGIESLRPVIYHLRETGGGMEFSIGGYSGSGGTEVQVTTNLINPNWQSTASFAATTNLLTFRHTNSSGGLPLYFRLKR